MRTGGILLIAGGAILIYWVLRSGLASELSSSPSSSSSGAGSEGSNSSSSAQQTDIGTHSAIDTSGTETGTVGQVYTVNSTYADATDQQRNDMNTFANASGG